MRQNFDEVKAKLQPRGVKEEIFVEFLRLDESRRDLLVKVEEMKKYRNDVSAEIAQLKRNKEDATAKIAEMKEVGGNIKALLTKSYVGSQLLYRTCQMILCLLVLVKKKM